MNWSSGTLQGIARSLQSETDADLPEGVLINDPESSLKMAPLNNAFITYLFANESVQTAGTGTLGLSVDGTVQGKHTDMESMGMGAVYGFNDERFLMVTGSSDHDTLHSIPYANIVDYTASSGGLITRGKLEFETPNHQYILTHEIGNRARQLLETERGVDLPEVSMRCEPAIVCTKCHEQVGEDAERCPHCGYTPDGRTTIAAVRNHPVGVCAGYEYVELENVPSKLEWFETENSPPQEESDKSSSQNDAGDDPYDKLRKLEELHDDGVLSKEEFENKKQEILEDL